MGNCVTVLFGISVVLTASFCSSAGNLLLLFGASGETLPYAWRYMDIYVCGTSSCNWRWGSTPLFPPRALPPPAC